MNYTKVVSAGFNGGEGAKSFINDLQDKADPERKHYNLREASKALGSIELPDLDDI